MMAADLSPLMCPRSIAVFGASARPGRPGHDLIAALGLLGSTPRVYPVTPRYEMILGYACMPDAAALPEAVDLAVIASGAARILSDCDAALGAGARALHVVGDLPPADCDKLKVMARSAGAVLLGPNSVGFVNYTQGTLSTWIAPPEGQRGAGGIALVLQSGALISYANEIDPRLRFSLAVQPGREAGATLSDMMSYSLDLPGTRVVGLYLETVADPDGFVAALARAEMRGVPVVALTPGRSQAAADAIATHARRLAGGTAALEAVFRRYGVVQVRTMDDFWTTLRLFSADLTLGPGGLALVTDSGAQRAMTLDAASAVGLPLARFTEATEAKLKTLLSSDLEPRNPLDIWSGEEDLPGHTEACLRAALEDQDTALALVLTDFGVPEADTFPTRMAEGALRVASGNKPVVAASFATRHFFPARILDMEAKGIPVLDGLETSFAALAHLFARRDRLKWPTAPHLSTSERAATYEALAALRPADEASALAVLSAAGVSVAPAHVVYSREEAISTAAAFDGPVVLKTAEPILHKTEARGVHLDLREPEAVAAAYEDLAGRIGPRVLVAPMVRGGVELALGALVDPAFGPMVMVGAGGVAAEILADRRFALAPVSEEEALAMLAGLRLSPLLDPYRGRPGIDRAAAARAVAALSRLVAAFPDHVREIDVNPLITGPQGAVAVDAVILSNPLENPL
jgi:acyl-CoA synthetase (NDP forming)